MKVVIALGGNALGKTPKEQLELVKETSKSIVDLIEKGHQVIIAHGNGPQVGMINKHMSAVEMPFPECGAMSQGYIGYHLQNAIKNELNARNIDRSVATVVTQVEVSPNDAGFTHPTKPIGEFYSKEEAKLFEKQLGYTMIEDSGRGYRRVVPSPKPINIIEKDVIRTLINQNIVVITVGGGGIPVIIEDNEIKGVPAVIDKDFASAALADIIEADLLCILTAVDHVMINFGTPEQKALGKVTVDELEEYINEGHFAAGSMLPKVEAAIGFINKNKDKKAIIASLQSASMALEYKTGTIIGGNKE
jgi:carbamate kinase